MQIGLVAFCLVLTQLQKPGYLISVTTIVSKLSKLIVYSDYNLLRRVDTTLNISLLLLSVMPLLLPIIDSLAMKIPESHINQTLLIFLPD